jgi:hypothetical protein
MLSKEEIEQIKQIFAQEINAFETRLNDKLGTINASIDSIASDVKLLAAVNQLDAIRNNPRLMNIYSPQNAENIPG